MQEAEEQIMHSKEQVFKLTQTVANMETELNLNNEKVRELTKCKQESLD